MNAKVKTFTFYELENAKAWILTPEVKIKRHGITFGMERIEDTFYLTFKVLGTLTHEDYEKMTPFLDAALESVSEPKINVFVDITEFENWEFRAAWDDFKIALRYGSDFEKIAIFGTVKWLEYGIKLSSWFVSGEIQHFDTKEEALSWLKA